MSRFNDCIVPTYMEVFNALKGRKGLKTSKPKNNGFIQYAWRMARFNSGIDMTMPVNCEFDMKDWFDSFQDKEIIELSSKWYELEGYEKDQWFELSKIRKSLLVGYEKQAELLGDQVLIELGLDRFKAAKVWGKALGW